MKAVDAVRKLAMNSPYFTVEDVKRIAGGSYAYLLLNKMIKRGEVFRAGRGIYTRTDDPVVAVYYFKPAYIGLQEAMSYHGLWEQETATIIITSRKVRRGEREVFGSRVIVRVIDPRHFFGYEFVEMGNLCVPVSDIEKTFIDLLYFRSWIRGYERLFRGKINPSRLKDYLSSYDSGFVKRIGPVLKKTGIR